MKRADKEFMIVSCNLGEPVKVLINHQTIEHNGIDEHGKSQPSLFFLYLEDAEYPFHF